MRTAPEHLAIHQHALRGFRNYPYLCVLQAPGLGGRDCIMCPVTSAGEPGPTSPSIMLDGLRHVIVLRLMQAVPVLVLADAVGSATEIRPDIGRAIDRLFFGI